MGGNNRSCYHHVGQRGSGSGLLTSVARGFIKVADGSLKKNTGPGKARHIANYTVSQQVAQL